MAFGVPAFVVSISINNHNNKTLILLLHCVRLVSGADAAACWLRFGTYSAGRAAAVSCQQFSAGDSSYFL